MAESDRQGRISQLIESYRALRRAQARLGEVNADENLFSLFDVGADEVSHSAFLAWLFDPLGSHGQGSRFLQAFLDAAEPEVALQLPEIYKVETELNRMMSVIDIAAFKAGVFVLYVENKTTSPDTPGQHDREIEDLRRLGATLEVALDRQIPVYLTPNGRRAQGEHADLWYRAAYRDLGSAFARERKTVSDPRTSLILKDWLQTMATFGGAWRRTMTHLSESSVLLGSNWPTVLDLERARERMDQELVTLLFSLEADLVRQPWWNQGWRFRQDSRQIWILNPRWRGPEGKDPLWMGVYRFDANHVFGPQSPPIFYLRVHGDCPALKEAMRESLIAGGHQVLGDHRHLVHRAVLQCPADQAAIEAYPGEARAQMLALFTEYAEFAIRHEDTIREHMGSRS